MGDLASACAIFQTIHARNVVSWTIMAAAFAANARFRDAVLCFRWMELGGVRPDKHAFTTIVEACTDGALGQYGMEIQARIIEAGLESDVFVGTAIVHMHGKLERIDRAIAAFGWIKERNVVSWTAMISAFANTGHYKEALELLKSMDLEGVKPNCVTFTVLLEACAGLGDRFCCEILHSRIEGSESSISSAETVVSALVFALGKCGHVDRARRSFERLEAMNLVSRTAMMAAYAQNGHHREALQLFWELDLDGIKHDAVSFVSVLEASSSLQMAKSFHSRILASGIRVSVITGTALVTTYRKCGALGLARSTFDGIAGKSILCWNTMISAYAQHGHAMEALKLFNALKQAGERPNSITFVSAIAACGHVGRLDDAVYNLSSMIADYRITPSSEHLGCMIDLLGRAGRLEEAERMVDKISPDDAAERIMQWKALLAACKVHGDFKRGGRVARRLLELDPGSDAPYVLLFNLYVDKKDNPG
ncbi:pentatricopeptide repeat-containing protein At3g12770 [Selaginella moellendorffii]|uniref:pentatricopeptide repeat-containing protein At3g12770 n=1 Tax=Selaginella moellendorffii TaxID=88036 RepID=UPI000D1C9CC6|nr:pentatricopeptide repeat-containing protein At3g12770 [Selaginella moellendorffii]|eukprot:XP_024543999.1 pentatricopeptide repeat-containing protein At3g12770 [Selaginella moellendorffii]